jgi:hypothetical protein
MDGGVRTQRLQVHRAQRPVEIYGGRGGVRLVCTLYVYARTRAAAARAVRSNPFPRSLRRCTRKVRNGAARAMPLLFYSYAAAGSGQTGSARQGGVPGGQAALTPPVRSRTGAQEQQSAEDLRRLSCRTGRGSSGVASAAARGGGPVLVRPAAGRAGLDVNTTASSPSW